jgi:hypothetical protein
MSSVAERPQIALATSLQKAQASVRAIAHDARNDFHKYAYTSAEAIISECKSALNSYGLTLLPTCQQIVQVGEQIVLTRAFTLLHTSGEERPLTTAWPVVPDKGRPLDKAAASATTTSLAYLLRDLLLAPRVDPADDLAGREERPAAKKPFTIDATGVKRLRDLADKKGVGLGKYLPAGVAVEQLSTEEARGIWTRIAALANVPPPEANGNRSGGTVHIEEDTAPAVTSRPPARASSVPF